MGQKGFFTGAIVGLIVAFLASLGTPYITSLVSGVNSIVGGIASTSFISVPLIFGIVGAVASRR